MNISLFVIPKPEEGTRAVFIWNKPFPGPFMEGAGPVNLTCGNCDFHLAKNVDSVASIRNMVLKCPRCKAYNEGRH